MRQLGEMLKAILLEVSYSTFDLNKLCDFILTLPIQHSLCEIILIFDSQLLEVRLDTLDFQHFICSIIVK